MTRGWLKNDDMTAQPKFLIEVLMPGFRFDHALLHKVTLHFIKLGANY